MHVLFLHKNFPAQFRYLAPRLVSDFGWRCTFLTAQERSELPGVEKLLYRAHGGASLANHVCTRNFENAVAEAAAVYETLKQSPDLKPDLIVAHAGFGSSLFLPFLTDAPVINFFEYFYRPVGGDLGYRPEDAVTEESLLRIKTKNAMLMLDLENCTRGWTPTNYQRRYFPPEWHSRIEVIFDGIDTRIYHRQPDARRRLMQELELPDDARIITYAARGFEAMRGFDIFIQAAQKIAEAVPSVVFIVTGGDTVHYGNDLARTGGKTVREHILSQFNVDLSRFRFTGFVAEQRLAEILSASDVHIYLTEPFIASWSMVDAMSCGAVVVASDQECVREYIEPGRNGLLVDFFDIDGLARQVIEVLRDPAAYRSLGEAATRTVAEKYSLDVAVPKLVQFFEQTAQIKREPSLLASHLIRPGLSDEDNAASLVSGFSEGSVAVLPDVPSEPAPSDVTRQALREFQQATRDVPDSELPIACQRFRGPAPWFEQLGPFNHPDDLTRLLTRVSQWRPRTIVDAGNDCGGRMRLWTQAATSDARIIAAGLPGQSIPALRMSFFNGLARDRQSVRCVTQSDSQTQIQQRAEQLLDRRWIDVLWLDGCQPFDMLKSDFEAYSRLVRKGGLIGWDGIGGKEQPAPAQDGGFRLWEFLKPKVSRHAEFLAGVQLPRRGIALFTLE
ncbi:glycosyltransferase [bacterium]|nr:glycosyltransferase [bacterium]